MRRLFLFFIGLISVTTIISQQQINRTLSHDGLNRDYIIYIPAVYDGTTPFPVMFSFHGGGGTSMDFMNYTNDMRPIADTAGFIAIYPQAAVDPSDGSNAWLHKAPTNHNDVTFIEAIIDTLNNEFSIDNNRVYACGYSEGGIFSYELGCRLNDKIAGFASVSGSMFTDSFRSSYYNLGICSPSHPTAVILIPGTSDSSPHSDYNGLAPYYMSVNEITNYWSFYNNTNTNPTIYQVSNLNTTDGSTVERKIWENGDNCVTIEELKVIGGGHDWPGSFGNMDIIATNEIWNFVSKYDKNGLINCATNIHKELPNNEFVFYPNPVSDKLFIEGKTNSNCNYYIFSKVGKLIRSGNINNIENSIDFTNLQPNLYILKINNKATKILKL